jgi:hypothetical protein
LSCRALKALYIWRPRNATRPTVLALVRKVAQHFSSKPRSSSGNESSTLRSPSVVTGATRTSSVDHLRCYDAAFLAPVGGLHVNPLFGTRGLTLDIAFVLVQALLRAKLFECKSVTNEAEGATT